jgi:hypothetical protein
MKYTTNNERKSKDRTKRDMKWKEIKVKDVTRKKKLKDTAKKR